jgi:hypothetical protein
MTRPPPNLDLEGQMATLIAGASFIGNQCCSRSRVGQVKVIEVQTCIVAWNAQRSGDSTAGHGSRHDVNRKSHQLACQIPQRILNDLPSRVHSALERKHLVNQRAKQWLDLFPRYPREAKSADAIVG